MSRAGRQQTISAAASERAYEALRGMAVRFELKPGERLNEVELGAPP